MTQNVHIYPAPIVNESRIFKETKSLGVAELFDSIEIVGHHQAGLPDVDQLSNGRQIIRVKSLANDKQTYGILGKLVWFALWMTRVFWRYRKADVSSVNAHSVAVLPLCWLIARVNKGILVYDTHELETETPVMVGAQGWLLKRVEQLFIRQCDLVIAVNQGIADWYSDTYNIDSPLVIRNIPEEDNSGTPIPNLRSLLGIPAESLIFIHTGRLGYGRNIPAILNAFSRKATHHHVVFLGDGPLLADILEAGKTHGNVHHIPSVPHGQVVTWAKGADAGLCVIETVSKSYEYSLPNKFAECLMAGIPVVSTYLREAHRMLGDEFLELLVRDVDNELAPLIKGITRESLKQFNTSDRTWKLPSWREESSKMTTRYRSLLASPDK